MKSEDYYNILGVPESSSIDEIKKAYRKLSLTYHPDRTQGDVEKAKIFQKVSEAYEILGDADKRREYDMSRKNPFMRMNGFGENVHHGEVNINDLFENLFFGGMPSGMMHGMHGMHGMPGMPGIFAGGFPPGANIRIFRNGVPVDINQIEKPATIVKTIQITMETVLNGGKIPIEIERWIVENGNKVFETTIIYVDIFKGIDHNEIILLKDQGNIMNEMCKGDVKIFVNINNDTCFNRRGLDLIMEKEISLKESLCGFSFDIKYLNGKTYTINNLTGNIIPPEYQKIIPNMGLTREGHTGNLIIHFHTKFPETLSKEQIDTLNKIL
uniref:J domain-containing protein n=1 Tax=viral metagenome TaxID=1070528 RepID=A0A6C0D8A5_9ZZZZ